MVGSAGGCGTKVGEANEYDLNVILDLPFLHKSIRLNFEDSSPTYASIEVTEEIVSSILSDLSLCNIENKTQFHKDESQDFDIFVKRNNKYIISSRKVLASLALIINNLNGLNSNGGGSGGQGPVEMKEFKPRLYQDIMILENDWGFDYIHHDMNFSVDITCCLRIPVKAFMHHPKIPQAIKTISNLISIDEDAKFATMIPKTSKHFEAKNNAILKTMQIDLNNASIHYIGWNDWRIDFYWIENCLLTNYENSRKCLMLLKYLALWNRNFSSSFKNSGKDAGIWSYFLKTVVMTTIIQKPCSEIWKNENLFNALLFCCENLKSFLSSKPVLFDIFDERFKLLEVDEHVNKGFYETSEEFEIMHEARIQLEQSSGRLIKRNQYDGIRNCVANAIKIFESKMDGDASDVVKYLETDLFGLKTNRALTWFVNALNERSCSEKVFPSHGGVIAKEEFRQRWDTSATWRSYVVKDSYFSRKAQVMAFRLDLFAKETSNTVCRNCGLSFSNLNHVYLDCVHSSKFWDDYANDVKISHKSFKAAIIDKHVLRHWLLVPPTDEKLIERVWDTSTSEYEDWNDRDCVYQCYPWPKHIYIAVLG